MSKTVSIVPDLEKVARKLAALPTIEDLRAEADPHEMDEETFAFARAVAGALIAADPRTGNDLQRVIKAQQKIHKRVASKSMLLAGYKHLTVGGVAPRREFIEDHLISKAPRSNSGVLVVTVFTSAFPDNDVDDVTGEKKKAFSCQWNCYYCPNEPGQPRSYLLNEPGVRRANRLDFDPIRQFADRVRALQAIGHPADKVELLVLGGTWESYPVAYRERFIRDLFYAANTYYDDVTTRRPALDIAQEHALNETARCKIIGLTLETRPDTIDPAMLVDLRRLGCTRVQIGVQHTHDGILRGVNREATRADTARAIRLLKDACFKVDIHLMPDLPGATPDLDIAMFDDVLDSPELQADQWKIYPCMTTPFSVIQRWYEEGKYRSYGLDALMEVILHAKRRVHPWIRLNRVIRDIPVEYVLEGIEVTNLRQLLQIKLKQEEGRGGRGCRCIRCREIKSAKDAGALARTAVLRRREYAGSAGREVFLSYETADEAHLFGFVRLRIVTQADQTPSERSPFPELAGCALVRELHVYGNLVVARPTTTAASEEVVVMEVRPNASGVDEDDEGTTTTATAAVDRDDTPLGRRGPKKGGGGDAGSASSPVAAAAVGGAVQHMGFGTRLLAAAEAVAVEAGVTRTAVISGIGVRAFYRRRGYELEVGPGAPGGFMIKRKLDHAAPPVVDGTAFVATTSADAARLIGGGGGLPRHRIGGFRGPRAREPVWINKAAAAVAIAAVLWAVGGSLHSSTVDDDLAATDNVDVAEM